MGREADPDDRDARAPAPAVNDVHASATTPLPSAHPATEKIDTARHKPQAASVERTFSETRETRSTATRARLLRTDSRFLALVRLRMRRGRR